MRKAKLYLRFFWPSLLLIATAVVCWVYLSDSLGNFKVGLISSALGIGISISIAEGIKKIAEHKRIKKTMGFLKLVTVPYLKNQAENLRETLQQYQDICSVTQAQSLLILASNFDSVSLTFDKSWLGLVYSQDSIEAINDNQFNKTANIILELLLFTKMLTAQSINAKHLLANDVSKFGENETAVFLEKTRQLRDSLNDGVSKLEKYADKLNDELDIFFVENGAKYEEFDR